MSAWMCSEAHFNALLTYAVAMDVTFQDPRSNHTAITLETASAIGQVLIDENARSLLSRYRDPVEENTWAYTFQPFPHVLTRGEAVCALGCLDYQSCESDDYRTTLAAVIVKAIWAAAGDLTSEQLKGQDRLEYEACPWGIDDADQFSPARRALRLKGGRYADRHAQEA